MLVGQERRKTDQDEPQHHSEPRGTAQVSGISVDQEKEQSGVQRGKEIVGRVEPAEPIKERAQPSLCMRPGQSEAQRNCEKENSSHHDRTRHSRHEYLQLALGAEKEGRRDKEKIDREVGKNHERDERNRAFPGEEKNADIVALRRNPETAAVNNQKEERQSNRRAQRLRS